VYLKWNVTPLIRHCSVCFCEKRCHSNPIQTAGAHQAIQGAPRDYYHLGENSAIYVKTFFVSEFHLYDEKVRT